LNLRTFDTIKAITDAIAFGDFLSGRARIQAADVGIRLEPRTAKPTRIRRASTPSRKRF